METPRPTGSRLKRWLIGGARSPRDPNVFHNLSLIAFFAWVGLGADGLSSSCYGPPEAFLALGSHHFLGLFVALATVVTIFVISSCYSQIIELFPTGGGGYLVASKLLSPTLGMVSGSALLVDYVLTITLSVASGADALFSFLPPEWYSYRLGFAVAGVLLLIVMNLRGVKESVVPLVPIFLAFVISHVIAIFYAFSTNLGQFAGVARDTLTDVRSASAELGFIGMLFLIMRAYSMGAGTYTGIEAVSNGLPILREPRVQTGKRTMHYMAFSLAFMAMGLMVSYLLFRVELLPGKTLNAVLFEKITAGWGHPWGDGFVWFALLSEAAVLIIAAQTGFLGGPRILANMALDRWVPSKFANLSDRLVSQNGVLLMGGASLILMVLSKGSVGFLVVLYSINVFITFTLSQMGMVRHWWLARARERAWIRKMAMSGIGLAMTSFILLAVIVLKFNEGGWITLFITLSLVILGLMIQRHYRYTAKLLKRLDALVPAVEAEIVPAAGPGAVSAIPAKPDSSAKTAIMLVNGFNGLGLHTLLNVIRLFGSTFRNFVFISVGVVDAGAFKGSEEMERLDIHSRNDANRYVTFLQQQGYYAEAVTAVGIDVVEEIEKLAPDILKRFPNSVFFGGQIVFPKEPYFSRWLHNYTIFALQRRFYHQGIPVVILPIRV
jgi:amino acid transporter